MSELIHVATITSPHGVKGHFKINCLLESPENIAEFPALYNESGENVSLTFISLKSAQPIASLENITDRNEVEVLRGMKLFAKQEDFPKANEGEFYSHQLAGLEVRNEKGDKIGETLAHHNFGAGDILEIKFNNGTTEMMPFDGATFPDVDIEDGFVVFINPDYI